MEQIKLRDCPFCGEAPKVVQQLSMFSIGCDNTGPNGCGCTPHTVFCLDLEAAAKTWNKRCYKTDVEDWLVPGTLFMERRNGSA